MKLHTPEKSLLLDVTSVKPVPAGLLIEGKIMGAMPMKAILTPLEMRQGLRLLKAPVIFRILRMLIWPKRRSG
jgi:hypothetical protein